MPVEQRGLRSSPETLRVRILTFLLFYSISDQKPILETKNIQSVNSRYSEGSYPTTGTHSFDQISYRCILHFRYTLSKLSYWEFWVKKWKWFVDIWIWFRDIYVIMSNLDSIYVALIHIRRITTYISSRISQSKCFSYNFYLTLSTVS